MRAPWEHIFKVLRLYSYLGRIEKETTMGTKNGGYTYRPTASIEPTVNDHWGTHSYLALFTRKVLRRDTEAAHMNCLDATAAVAPIGCCSDRLLL